METLPPVSWKCLFWFLVSSQFPSHCPFTLQSGFISYSMGTLFADILRPRLNPQLPWLQLACVRTLRGNKTD